MKKQRQKPRRDVNLFSIVIRHEPHINDEETCDAIIRWALRKAPRKRDGGSKGLVAWDMYDAGVCDYKSNLRGKP